MKRVFDLILSSIGLIIFSPLLITVCIAVWLQDFHSPFYVAPRVGKNGRMFKMMKLRSMVINADKSGVDSTGANDKRITAVGRFIRAYKLDELSQLINVFKGDMSLVGPRPNVQRDVDLYTDLEKKLLSVKPGITDFSSIVFSDEGDILKDKEDPDVAYNQLIRPWKSRLGLLYIEKQSLWLDAYLIYLTIVAIVSKQKALKGINSLLNKYHVSDELKHACLRNQALNPFPPPGSETIVTSRG